MKKRTKNRLEYIAFRIGHGIFSCFPLGVNKWIMSKLFIFGGLVLGIRKDIAVKNLALVYPNLQGKDLTTFLKQLYHQMGITTAETYFGNYHRMFKRVKTVGWEYVDEAVAMDKGVIMASAHIGNWELAGRYISLSHKMSVIYKRLRNNLVDSYTNKLRDDFSVVLIEKKVALRKVLKLLKEKYIVTIMIDQNARSQGVQIDFLGSPASTFVGTAKIAFKTGAPIVPAIAIRENDGSHTFYFEKPILPEDFKDQEYPIQALTEYVSKQIEPYILKYPEQWFWVHRRWRKFSKARNPI